MWGPDDRCERADSSEARAIAEGPSLRIGEGGSVGTVVVVETAVIIVAFCRASFEGCSAYLTRFGLLCVVAVCTEVPSPVIDIAVESEPCCKKSAVELDR